MFALTDADLDRTILGCGDGPASFNAEMTHLGHQVTSIDPIYQFSAAEIRGRVQAVYDPVLEQVRLHAGQFVWTQFPDPEALGRSRWATMQRFLADYDQGQAVGRYRPHALPRLPFADQQFDLALCSHLLFLYSQQRSLTFHLQSILELVRVAAEVRIFPLVTLAGERSPHLPAVLATLNDPAWVAELVQVRAAQSRQAAAERVIAPQIAATIEPVAYEFQRGGNEMLRLRSTLPASMPQP
jgi:SAM-dependent methyltransferase